MARSQGLHPPTRTIDGAYNIAVDTEEVSAEARFDTGTSVPGGKTDVIASGPELPFLATSGERQDKLAKDRR